MKKTYYYKLIRDRVPAKMDRLGKAYETKHLREKEFKMELLKKIGEEASGLISSYLEKKDRKEMAGELANVQAVVDEVRRAFGIRPAELALALKENFRKKGGFKKRIYLVWSETDNYRTNERRYKAHRPGR